MVNPFLIVAGAATAVALVWSLRSRWKFMRGARALARRLSAEYIFRDRDRLRERFADLALWRYGHARRVRHVLRGQAGRATYWCFADQFDLGFGRQRVERSFLGFIAESDIRAPGVLCAHEMTFFPSGKYMGYRPLGGSSGEAMPNLGWRVWMEGGDDRGRTWSRIEPVCRSISDSGLIEVCGERLVVWVQRDGSVKDYQWIIEKGLELIQVLRA